MLSYIQSLQISHCIRYLSQFVVGFAVGFMSVWQLTLLTLAVVPLIVVAGGAYAVTMSTLSKKGEAAYAQAGKVSEEVITHFLPISRTNSIVFSSLIQHWCCF